LSGVRYARNPEVLWRSTSRGPVLLAPAMEHPQLMSGLAAVVWELLEHPASLPDLKRVVAEIAGTDIDLTEAITGLDDEDLLLRS
jgi:hypothetical protein